MIEVFKHALGFCGEHWHPNLFTMLASGFGILPALVYTRNYFRNKLFIRK